MKVFFCTILVLTLTGCSNATIAKLDAERAQAEAEKAKADREKIQIDLAIAQLKSKADDKISDNTLEKRVANLELEVADLRAQPKLPPKAVLDIKLIGSWGVEKPVDKGLKALRLELDGTCLVVVKRGSGNAEALPGKFKVVGNVISMQVMRTGGGSDFAMEVESVNEKDLVLGPCTYGNYLEDEKNVRLQRQ